MWLLCVHSLLFCILLRLSVADVRCYKCLWTDKLLEDSCSPMQFNESVGRIEQCRYGCLITASYTLNSLTSYARACALKYVESRQTCTEAIEAPFKEVNCFCDSNLCNDRHFGIETLTAHLSASGAARNDYSSGIPPVQVPSRPSSGSPNEMTTSTYGSSSLSRERTMDYFSSKSPPYTEFPEEGRPSRDYHTSRAEDWLPTTSKPKNGGEITNLSRWSIALLLFALCTILRQK